MVDPSKGCAVCEDGYMSDNKDQKIFCTTKTHKNCKQGTIDGEKVTCYKCSIGYWLKTDKTCQKIEKPTISGCEAYINLGNDVLGCELCKGDDYFVSKDKKSCVKAASAQKGCLTFYKGSETMCETCNFYKNHFAIGAKESSDGKQSQKCEKHSSNFWLWVYSITGVVLITVIIVGIVVIKKRTTSKQADLYDSMIEDNEEY